jgi:hypothetical protein
MNDAQSVAAPNPPAPPEVPSWLSANS